MKQMDANEIISYIQNAKKSTPVKVYVKGGGVASLNYGESAKVFGEGDHATVFGEWSDLEKSLKEHGSAIED